MRTNKFIAFLLAFTMVVSVFCSPILANGKPAFAAPLFLDEYSGTESSEDKDSNENKSTDECNVLMDKKELTDEEREAEIKEFVTRMYRVCLDRVPDETGLDGWTENLMEKRATGCSVAYGFIFSPEFQDKKATNSQYVTYMYDAFFGRKPDTDGFNYWVELLDDGMERESVFCGFANSLEFANLCEEYGVVRGYHVEGTDFNQTAMVNLFVERLYNVILGRNCDQEGMAGWTMKLTDHTMSGGEVAYGFVFSPEFLNLNLCNAHYTEVLYEAFLGRSSDKDGKAYWVDILDSGNSRENVFNGFAGSVEFAAICISYGIEAGKVDVSGATYQTGTCTRCAEDNSSEGNTSDRTPESNPTSGSNSGSSSNTSSGSEPTPGVSFGDYTPTPSNGNHNSGNSSNGSGNNSNNSGSNGGSTSTPASTLTPGANNTPAASGTSTPTPTGSGKTTPTGTTTPTPTGAGGSTTTPTPTEAGGSTTTPTPTGSGTPTPTVDPLSSVTPTPEITPSPTAEPTPEGIAAYKNSKYTENMGEAVIIIPSDANSRESYSAGIIQKAIENLDGYTPDIISDSTAQGSTGKREISVGNTNRPHGTPQYSSSGSYSIKAYEDGVSITGVGQRGLIDGSVYFLQLCGGYFWLTWENGLQTHQDCFKYSSDISYDYARSFKYSDIDFNYWNTAQGNNRMYSLSFGLNGCYSNVINGDCRNAKRNGVAGAQIWYLSSGGDYSFAQPGLVHTLTREYFTEADYKAHPEWFANQSSDTPFYDRQLCLSQPGVYERIKEHVFEMLDNPNIYDPYAQMQIISLAQSDNGSICNCSACSKFRSQHYSDTNDYQNSNPAEVNSALYLDLCNKISQDIKAKGVKEGKDYSNVYVDMLAYVCNKIPPINMSIDDHVIIRCAPIERCCTHSIKESCTLDQNNGCYENNELSIYLKGWSNLVKNNPGSQLWIWDYSLNFRDSLAPFTNIYAMADDIKFYKELGASGIYLQNSVDLNSHNSEYGDLRVYILSVLMRDTNADVDKEIEFFMHEYYGDAADYMLETLDILTAQGKRHNVGSNVVFPGEESHKGNIYLNNLWYRDYRIDFLTPASRIYNNNYPSGYDAHNRMTDSDIARMDELYNLALAAVEDDPDSQHLRNVNRTMLGWRYVKSIMKVSEFSNPGTYLQRNKELYNDMFVTYHFTRTNFLFNGIPSGDDATLSKTPDKWLNG